MCQSPLPPEPQQLEGVPHTKVRAAVHGLRIAEQLHRRKTFPLSQQWLAGGGRTLRIRTLSRTSKKLSTRRQLSLRHGQAPVTCNVGRLPSNALLLDLTGANQTLKHAVVL